MVFNLSDKEFLFLCFAAGATQVHGIEDAFKNVNTDDMSSEIRKVHNSLEGKNYIESDFDGNSVINQTLLDYIRICVSCEKQVMFNSSKADCFESVNYYIDSDFSVMAKKVEDEYVISRMIKDDLLKDFISNISFKSKNEFKTSYEITFKQNELEQLKKDLKLGQKDATISQLKTKVKDEFLDVIVSALEEKEDFYAMAIIDNDSGDSVLETIMVIDTDKGAMIVQPQIVELDNAVKIIACKHCEVTSLINRFAEKITK